MTRSANSIERGPRQNYLKMGLNVGERLVFLCLPEEEVTVAGEYHLRWRGSELSMTALLEKLGKFVQREKFPNGLTRYPHGKITDVSGRYYNEMYEAFRRKTTVRRQDKF